MTMLSVRVDDMIEHDLREWSARLGIDRSALVRDALRAHLVRLSSEHDATIWEAVPLDAGEQALADVADWGPAEDWSDWSADAAR